MLDMGFIPDIERICSLLPPRRQTLFFSATMPPEIERLTKRFLNDPVKVEVARKNSVVETIDQKLVRVSGKPEEKRAALRQLIRGAENFKNAIIFCNRKREVATLARSLQRHGFSAGGLHGDMDQKSRMETLDAFKTDKLTLLVASDVAARGLDIPAVSHVFNFDVPTHAEDYIHRIGRTGRAGRSGTSITLATPADGKYLDAIQRLIQRDIPVLALDGASQIVADEAPAEARRSRGHARSAAGRRPDRVQPRATSAPSTEADRVTEPAAAPRREETGRRQERPQRRSGPAGNPFGDDGPIPAFLLRSHVRSE
jgi:superfamily II DNA/RNA helicase